MATAEAPAPQPAGRAGPSRRRVWAALAVVLGGALALRLWGVRQGLPYAYNADEADHFVPHAVQMFQEGTLNPHYFANPPAFTYLLHFLFALAYGGAGGAVRAYRLDPTEVYTLARIAAAVLGTIAVWLLYLTGARLFGRVVGLLAAAIEAVAFLPVFYAHLALNDAPTLAPATLSLLGSAGVLRKGRLRDHALAGIGLGLACATKYTAGIVLVPYLATALASWREGVARSRSSVERADPSAGEEALGDTAAAGGAEGSAPDRSGRRGAGATSPSARLIGGVTLAAVCALGAFLLANPYALIDYPSFHRELVHQSTLSAEAQGKLGAPKDGGLLYYLWSLTWGLGWVPALAALGGGVAIWRRDARVGWMLVPASLLFLAFMGTQGRYFGRWLLPIFPILCLLAAFAVAALVSTIARRADSAGPARSSLPGADTERRWPGAIAPILLAAILVVALLGQGLFYSVHAGLVLSRTDTRTLTRNWMLANIPPGTRVVVEPVAPNDWAREPSGSDAPARCPPYNGYRWCKWPSEYTFLNPAGALDTASRHKLGIEDYERTLAPALIGYYESKGFCWVVTGSTESGRALADPRAVPLAIAYYRALAAQGEVVYRASPYSHGQGMVPFNFDWSFDYYPRAYGRPGPVMTVYRLHGGRCRA
ncbi:MAG: ArnT family glycosyltransferase [Solirubrobacteraceae bacterium]